MERPERSRGFTLIELMIVVIVVGVLAGIATPSLRGAVQRARVRSAMASLYSAFNEAQGLAKSKGHAFCLAFDRSKRQWAITEDADLDSTCEVTIKTQVLDDAAGIGYRPTGYGPTFPSPYDSDTSFPHDTWCTVCGASTGSIRFEVDGNITIPGASTPVGGSIAIYDASGLTNRISGLVFVTRTGSVHIYEQN